MIIRGIWKFFIIFMILYNAIEDGWKVTMLDDNLFQFEKKISELDISKPNSLWS